MSNSATGVFCLSHTKPMNTGSRNNEPGMSCVPTTPNDSVDPPRNLKRASAYPAHAANAVASNAAAVQMISELIMYRSKSTVFHMRLNAVNVGSSRL